MAIVQPLNRHRHAVQGVTSVVLATILLLAPGVAGEPPLRGMLYRLAGDGSVATGLPLAMFLGRGLAAIMLLTVGAWQVRTAWRSWRRAQQPPQPNRDCDVVDIRLLPGFVRLDLGVRALCIEHEGTVEEPTMFRLAPDGAVIACWRRGVSMAGTTSWIAIDTDCWRLRDEVRRYSSRFPKPLLISVGFDDRGDEIWIDVGTPGGLHFFGRAGEVAARSLGSQLWNAPFAQHCGIIDLETTMSSEFVAADADHATSTTVMLGPSSRYDSDSQGAWLTWGDVSRRTCLEINVSGDDAMLTWDIAGMITVDTAVDASSDITSDMENSEVVSLSSIDVREPSVIVDTVPIDDDVPYSSPERNHLVRVCLLGEVSIESCNGETIRCDKSKAEELLAWLVTHRERPTRSAARNALWSVDVRPSTFSNVVSSARRSLAAAFDNQSEVEWIGRGASDHLVLHDGVVSDAELLARAIDMSRDLDALGVIEVLREPVNFIRGLPFQGASFLWPDTEGVTSQLVILATTATSDLATAYLSVGDVDGVMAATGRGLRVLPGHEELVALRMRARSMGGDTAALRQEWVSYERALDDEWGGGRPSKMLVDLRQELLGGRS